MKAGKFKYSFTVSTLKKIAGGLAALLIAAAAAAAWVGPDQAGEGMQRLFGLKPASEPAGQDQELSSAPVSEEPITIGINGGTVKITGFEPMTGSICLSLRLEQIPAYRVYPGFDGDSDPGTVRQRLDENLKQVYLIDQNGREYRYQGGNFVAEHLYCSGSAEGAAWSSDVLLELPDLSEQVQTLTLVVPLAGDDQLRKEFSLAALQNTGECRLPGVRITW